MKALLMLGCCLFCACGRAAAEPGRGRMVRIAELEIDPAQLENYADADAYKSHVESPHFKKYKVNTEKMVKSLKLVETEPVMMGAKPN